MRLVSRTMWGQGLLFLLLLFAAYSNVRLIIRNQEISRRLTEAKKETVVQEFNNKKLSLLIEYYQTASYQEVEARRRLNLKKPDEVVLTIQENGSSTETSDTLRASPYQDLQPEQPQAETNISRWWKYFFGD